MGLPCLVLKQMSVKTQLNLKYLELRGDQAMQKVNFPLYKGSQQVDYLQLNAFLYRTFLFYYYSSFEAHITLGMGSLLHSERNNI